jgi:chromosome partitioning protein
MTANATAPSGAWPGSTRTVDSYVITLANQKGGAGKTMLALALAAHTAAANGRALLVDVDPQANSYDLSAVMADPGYDTLHELDPAQLAKLRRLRDYDTILVDSPGSLGAIDRNGPDRSEDRAGNVLAGVLRESSFVLVPYDHTPEILRPTIRTAAVIRDAGVPFAVVVTKADVTGGEDRMRAWVEDAHAVLASAGVPYFRSFIRGYRAWPNSIRAGVPITRYSERHAPKVREDVARLHAELLLELGRRAPAGNAQ